MPGSGSQTWIRRPVDHRLLSMSFLGSRRTLTAAACAMIAGFAVTAPGAGAADATASALATPAATTVHRVLFDNTKAETAGNADWIISTSQPDPLGAERRTRPARPTGPARSPPGAWRCRRPAATAWRPCPPAARSPTAAPARSGPQQLRRVRDPRAERAAQRGREDRGHELRAERRRPVPHLDHNGSDRNNDGADSVRVINDLMTNNSVDNTDPFGFSVDLVDISTDNPTRDQRLAEPGAARLVRHGHRQHHARRHHLHAQARPTTPTSRACSTDHGDYSGNTGAFFVTSTFGSGRVAIWGDSSPVDDGTGQSGNTLFNGWNDPAGTDAALALNATAWLAGRLRRHDRRTSGGARAVVAAPCTAGQLLANPGLRVRQQRAGRPAPRSSPTAPRSRPTPARTRRGWTATAPPPRTRCRRP